MRKPKASSLASTLNADAPEFTPGFPHTHDLDSFPEVVPGTREGEFLGLQSGLATHIVRCQLISLDFCTFL